MAGSTRDADLARALLRSLARQRRERRLALARPPSAAPSAARAGTDWSLPPPPEAPSGDGPGPAPHRDVELVPATGTRLRFGLNHPRCYAWHSPSGTLEPDPRYGTPFEDALSDCAALGVDVVRQLGDVELTWPALSMRADMTSGEAGIGGEVPTLGRLRPAGSIDRAAVVSDETVGRLATLLDTAWRYRVKLVFTFLHFGNGGVKTDALPYPTDGDGVVAGSSDFPGRGRNVTNLKLLWSADHHGQRIPDDQLYDVDGSEYDFPAEDARPTSGTVPLHYQALDPWSPYERIMVRHLAELAGQVLVEAWEQAVSAGNLAGVELADVVEGIELLNELDHECTALKEDMEATGRAWGRLCYHAARGLRAAIPDPSVRILLPGLSSWQGTIVAPTDGNTWTDRLTFTRGLVNGFASEFQARARILREDTSITHLADLMQGMDLHWYHFRDSEPPLHAAVLAHEVEELRDAIEEGLAGLGTEAEQAALRAMPITMFETSTATRDAAEAGVYLPSVVPFSSMDLETFQALEAWRRLLAGVCAGLETSGWHCWMSGTYGNFVGTSLRADEDTVTAGPGDRRPAWHAYQAVAWLLRDVVSGSVVHPPTSSRDEVIDLMVSGTDAVDSIVVFELRLSHMGIARSPSPWRDEDETSYAATTWVYVVMLDPSANLAAFAGDGIVQGAAVSGAGGAWLVESVGTDGGSFVGTDPSTWVAQAAPLSVSFKDLRSDPTPRVFMCTTRLEWTTVDLRMGEGAGTIPGWIVERSPWWDGAPEGL